MDSQSQKNEKKLKDKGVFLKKQHQSQTKRSDNPEEFSPNSHNNNNPKPILDQKNNISDHQNSLNISFESNNINNDINIATAGSSTLKAIKVQNSNNTQKSNPQNTSLKASSSNNSKNLKNAMTPKNNKTNNPTIPNAKTQNVKSEKANKIQIKPDSCPQETNINIVEFYKKERRLDFYFNNCLYII